MNQESFDPLRENHPSEADDYPTINPYRWVRFGIILLLLAFVLLLPLIAVIGFFANFSIVIPELTQLPNSQRHHYAKQTTTGTVFAMIFMSAGIMGLLATLLAAVGCILLRFSPVVNERNTASQFLFAYAIAVVGIVTAMLIGRNSPHQEQTLMVVMGWSSIIAVVFGSYLLLNFFKVLAANRFDRELIWWSKFVGKFALLAAAVAIGRVVMSTTEVEYASEAFVVIASAITPVFWFACTRTLWLALRATRPQTLRPGNWSPHLYDTEY